MSKIRFAQIALGIVSLLIIFSVILVWINLASTDDVEAVAVYLEDGESEILKFENLALVPGSQCEYGYTLKGDNEKAYDVTLDFIEHFDLGLQHLAYVKITANGELVIDELLDDAIDNDGIGFHVDFGQDEDVELLITYYLPATVGNEAKNAEAVFDLRITASNE